MSTASTEPRALPAGVSAADRDVLRELARQVRALALSDDMETRRERWRLHNALAGGRPMVLCFPEGAWEELLPAADCRCAHPVLRGWEHGLRRTLFWWEHIRDDAAIEPTLDVYWHVDAGSYGVEIPKVWGDQRGSFVWDPPIKDLERDLVKLKPRTFRVDREATRRDLELAHDLVGDLLTPRLRGRPWWSVGLTQTLAYLIGIEPMMMAMIEHPRALHALMRFLQDDMLRFIEWCEAENLLTAQNEGDYVGSGGLAYTRDLPGGEGFGARRIPLSALWGFGESQESVGVSPMMFSEFILPYQVPLLARFGLNCYGCCEGLEQRIDHVLAAVPRLRRVSVAPKANQEILAEKLAGRYIFSRKADPVPVCLNADDAVIRADLRHTLAVAGSQPLEIILKDTHTVEHDPGRITRWVRVALEEVDAHMGRRP